MKKEISLPRGIYLVILFPFLLTGVTLPADPTRPPDSLLKPQLKQISSQSLKLTAIFITHSTQWAVINNVIVKLGDHINQFTVTTITPNTVELNDAQNNREVLYLVNDVKQVKP